MHKEYGDAILSSLPVETQQVISEVTWDPDTGRPLSKLDRELDDILQDGETLEYVDISLLTSTNERPTSVPASDTFVPQLDTTSVSTFGTATPQRQTKASATINTPATPDTDTTTVVSSMTMETKMSHLETRFDKIEDILHALVGKANISSPVTPPPASNTAEAVNAASANGG